MLKSNSPNADTIKHKHELILQLLFFWLCDLHSKLCSYRSFKSNEILRLRLSEVVDEHKLCNTMREVDANKWNELFDKYKSLVNSTTDGIDNFSALGCNRNSSTLQK